jgi:hypothetical protein
VRSSSDRNLVGGESSPYTHYRLIKPECPCSQNRDILFLRLLSPSGVVHLVSDLLQPATHASGLDPLLAHVSTVGTQLLDLIAEDEVDEAVVGKSMQYCCNLVRSGSVVTIEVNATLLQLLATQDSLGNMPVN